MASLIFCLHHSVSKFTELQFTVLQRVSFPTPVANTCSLRLVSLCDAIARQRTANLPDEHQDSVKWREKCYMTGVLFLISQIISGNS